ncbi:29677_t:CDS:2, partial [Racocetra persica]
PLLDLINEAHQKNNVGNTAEAITDQDQHVYDMNDVHQAISQFLVSYVFGLLENADHTGRAIPDVNSKICYEFASSGNCFAALYKYNKCQDWHTKPTPTILYNHLLLLCRQYTVMRKMLVLYHRRILKDNQSKNVLRRQRYWAEKLVDHLFRYQSPQTSCAEISYIVIRNHLNDMRNDLFNVADKVWLKDGFNSGKDFGAMLKCMFVLQQLRHKWGYNKFRWVVNKPYFEVKKTPLIGFEYDQKRRCYVSVGKHLYSFFYCLNFNKVIDAISHATVFIRYAIGHIRDVFQMDASESLGDLTSLIEFTISLVFAASPRLCDFCLPQSYLVNYFYAFDVKPLLPNVNIHNEYNIEDYKSAIGDFFDLSHQLLCELDFTKNYHSPIILRLLRLLILIGYNESICESTSISKVINLFSSMKFSHSEKINRYLKERSMGLLIKTLINDLRETGCDSLVVVYYRREDISNFAELINDGAKILKYNSSEEFRSSLWKIVSPVASERKEISESERKEISEDNPESAEEIQAWFQQITDSPHADKNAKMIQYWFRSVLIRKQKSRKYVRDTTLDKIYNDISNFCNDASHWEAAKRLKGKRVVRKYIMLLKGDASKTIDDETTYSCINLEDDLRFKYYDNVKFALKSLSTTENAVQHEKANVEWLENELQKTNDTIKNVLEWIDECKT